DRRRRKPSNRLLKAIKARNLNTENLQVLALADGAFFTADQAKAIVGAISFRGGDGQRQAAIWLYPRLVDRSNFNVVLDAIPYPLERQGGRAGPWAPCVTP